MKISEMNNEQASEAMIRLSTPISNICDDEEFVNLLDSLSKAGDMTLAEMVGKLLPKVITCAFKNHRDDLFEIVGALTMNSTETVAKMNFKDTIQAVKDSYDDILSSFFQSSVVAKGKNEKR